MTRTETKWLQTADAVVFAEDQLGFTLDDWQRDALRETARRQVFCCGRQVGKSTTAAIRALHTAWSRPGTLSLMLSPTLRQSSELFRTTMALYQRLEEVQRPRELSKLYCTLGNGSRIVSLPGDESTVRGYAGPALVVIDECARTESALLDSVLPMLATVPDGVLILLSTPNGRAGRFSDIWHDGGDIWTRYFTTSEKCPRISREFLEEQRLIMSPRFYQQEFECKFVEKSGCLFSAEAISAMFRPTPESEEVQEKYVLEVGFFPEKVQEFTIERALQKARRY